MPGREIPLITNEYYHILNRGVASLPAFVSRYDFRRAVEIANYYQYQNIPGRYSLFTKLSSKGRKEILKELKVKNKVWVEIIAYCFMPNHFHFLLKQREENGISKFMGNFTNSYTRYFNTRNKRKGPLFQGKFKAVRVIAEEQLLHLSRYIHLNPYTSFVIKELDKLEDYTYSSLPEYLGKVSPEFCSKEIILNQFASKRKYLNFVLNQARYQRELEEIKHLALEY